MQVIVDNLLTFYNIVGSGPAVVWLHGWGVDSRSLEHFAKLNLGYTHILVDLPGHGKTANPPKPMSLTDCSNFVKAFLLKISITHYSIVGHSNGGAISLLGAATKTLNPKCLVVFGASGVRNNQDQQNTKSKLKVISKIGKKASFLLSANAKKSLRQKLYKKVGSDALLKPDLIETFKLIVAEDITNKLANIMVPTLMIYGDEDDSTPPSFGKIMSSKIDNSQLVVIKNAGHYAFSDKPEECLRLTSKFLESYK
jgi:pimeloyl-ACP methyl ester carboxylesterase